MTSQMLMPPDAATGSLAGSTALSSGSIGALLQQMEQLLREAAQELGGDANGFEPGGDGGDGAPAAAAAAPAASSGIPATGGDGLSGSDLPLDAISGLRAARDDAPSAPASGTSTGNGSGTAGAPAATDAGTASGGAARSIDGAQAGPDTADFTLKNTSDHDETIALVNAQNQVFDQEKLAPGQSRDVLLGAADPNTKSMREELESSDGSPEGTDAKIGESNIADVGGHVSVSNDVSNNNFVGTNGTDGANVGGTQMTFRDDEGVTTGDDTANGPYAYANADRQTTDNPMNMAMDPSRHYELDVDGS